MSHKLILRNISGGIFILPDKSPTITAEGFYQAENLRPSDPKINNVIANEKGELVIGTLSAFSLGNYREFIFINDDTTPAQRYLNWSPHSYKPPAHSSSTSLVNTYDYTIQISNTDSVNGGIGVDVEAWLADFNNYGEGESRGIINITQKSDYTKRITGLVKTVSKETGGGGYHEITFNLIDNNKNTDMPFLPKDDFLETGAVLVYFTPQGTKGAKGDQGDTGAAGTNGTNGAKGDTGDTGGQGNQGVKGDQGLKGDTGDQGDQGLKGAQGDTGGQGNQGVKGDTGDQGDQGLKGAQGDTGGQGNQGLKGAQGDTGGQGDQGVKGDQGDTGDQGDQGLKGAQGDTGDQGNQGVKGDKGNQGVKGDQGLKGDTGDQGVKGAQGDTGDQGDQGLKGAQGDTGGQGNQGLKGAQGDTGSTGTNGTNGAKGAKGDTGDTGANGTNGNTGAQGPAGPGGGGVMVEGDWTKRGNLVSIQINDMRDYVLYTNEENQTIMWTRGLGRFTAGHYYEFGENMSEDNIGSSVIYNNGKIYLSLTPNDPKTIGFLAQITSGITSDTDSTLSSVAYCVSVGDSKEWRDTIDGSGNITGRSQYISGINICNEGGDIEIGDLICTSSTSGYFMKQADDLIHNYTAGKCMENITFNSTGKKQNVYSIMMCG